MKNILFCLPFIFSCGDKSSNVNYKEMLENGGLIIDVRSESEFSSGNIKSSLNIPLDKLLSNISQLEDNNQPIITCCASGMRSEKAKKILIKNGYKNVVNGGGWKSLRDNLK